MLKDRLEADLKAAMLSGDKTRVETLKMAKSALLYKAVELGVRDEGLSDQQTIEVLSKEAKKRLDAAEMYEKAGNGERAVAERTENQVISEYLPQQLSEADLIAKVESVIAAAGEVNLKDMGRIIGLVKAEVGSSADGSRIAGIVKQKLS